MTEFDALCEIEAHLEEIRTAVMNIADLVPELTGERRKGVSDGLGPLRGDLDDLMSVVADGIDFV